MMPLLLARRSLPYEGRLYDPPSLGNVVDLERQALTLQLSKTLRSSFLSSAFDSDLPAKLVLTLRGATVDRNGAALAPAARAALSLRLLDLGSADARQAGFLKFKLALHSERPRSHGFEIERRVALFGLPRTSLYGNIVYRTNAAVKAWTTRSSFGVHHDLRFAGVKCAARVGLTPDGRTVFDLKL